MDGKRDVARMPSFPADTVVCADSNCVGWEEAGQKFIDSLNMFYHVANIESRSLAIHPATIRIRSCRRKNRNKQASPIHMYGYRSDRTYRRYHQRSRSGAGSGIELGAMAGSQYNLGRFPFTRMRRNRRDDWNRRLVPKTP